MCLESTQALSNVLKIILTDSPDSQGGASLFVLRMLFAPSSFASLTKLIIPDSKLSPPETLDALFSSHIAQSWFSHRTSRDEILDVEQMGYFGPANSIDLSVFSPLSSRWDGGSKYGKVPLRIQFLDILLLPEGTTKTFPCICGLDPYADSQIHYCVLHRFYSILIRPELTSNKYNIRLEYDMPGGNISEVRAETFGKCC